MSRPRYPTGHTFSPSVVKTMRQCYKRHWMKKVRRLPDPPGPQAKVGTLMHRVLEVAALRRIEPAAGTEPLPPQADAAELLSIFGEVLTEDGAWVLKAVQETLEAAAPFDLEHVAMVEQLIERFPIGDGITIGGIVDRVDVWHEEDGWEHVLITDYKTGFVPPADELEESDQANLYLRWAAERFGIYDDRLALVFHWPAEDIKVAIRYDPDRVEAGVEAAKRIWRGWLDGPWAKTAGEQSQTKRPPPPGSLGVHCSHCPYRDQCQEYQEHIRKPARVHPWAGLDIPELVKLRHQVAADAKMLETARKELDQHLVVRLDTEAGGRFDSDTYSAKVQRDRLTNYSMGVVEALARATGLEVEDVMRAVCNIGTQKLNAFVNKHRDKHPRVARVVQLYATPSQKAPYIRARPKGGLF